MSPPTSRRQSKFHETEAFALLMGHVDTMDLPSMSCSRAQQQESLSKPEPGSLSKAIRRVWASIKSSIRKGDASLRRQNDDGAVVIHLDDMSPGVPPEEKQPKVLEQKAWS